MVTFTYVNWLISHHIQLARPGHVDLIAEVQRVERLPKPAFVWIITKAVKLAVVRWLEVCSLLHPVVLLLIANGHFILIEIPWTTYKHVIGMAKSCPGR